MVLGITAYFWFCIPCDAPWWMDSTIHSTHPRNKRWPLTILCKHWVYFTPPPASNLSKPSHFKSAGFSDENGWNVLPPPYFSRWVHISDPKAPCQIITSPEPHKHSFLWSHQLHDTSYPSSKIDLKSYFFVTESEHIGRDINIILENGLQNRVRWQHIYIMPKQLNCKATCKLAIGICLKPLTLQYFIILITV